MLRSIRKSLEKRDEGFTLIELLVVIIIIGILAAVAIPVFLNQRRKAWDSAAKSDVKNMSTAEETYLTDTNSYTDDLADLGDAGFKESADVLHDACFVGGTGYTVTAKHVNSDNYWYFDSNTGQLNSTDGVLPAGTTCAVANPA